MIFRQCLNPVGVTQVSPHLTFCQLAAWSVCCAARWRALEHISELWVCFLLTCSLVGWEHCAGLEKGSPLRPQISFNNLQRLVFSPWFTAPMETKLGPATVSAPGPLSSSQGELFAEDIQMYKEQIRLTQSSFAQWEREKEKKKKEYWLTSKRPLPLYVFNEWKGSGNEHSLVYSKLLIHNLFL